MTAAQRVGEIDADAIRHSMSSHTEVWLDGSQVRVIDEVHVLDAELLAKLDASALEPLRMSDEFALARRHADLWPFTSPWPTTSPAAASEGMPAVLPAKLPLAAGAENEVPGAGIPPPRPGPPNQTLTPTDPKGQQ